MQSPILDTTPAAKTKTYLPAFPATPTKTIKVAQQPPHINPEYREIPVEEFAKSEGIQWADSPLCETHIKDYVEKNAAKISESSKLCFIKMLLKAIGVDMDYDKVDYKTILRIFLSHANHTQESWEKFCIEEANRLEQFLSNPPPDLIIANIDKKVGKGVFLSPHAKPIKEGSIVCIYTGLYSALPIPSADKWHSYGQGLFEHTIFDLETNHQPYNAMVDAEKCGNIARYIQDLPKADDLKNYTMTDDIRARVATANLSGNYICIRNFPIAYLVASRDIQPGEMLGFAYGISFWTKAEYIAGIKHELFDLDGRIIESEHYQYHLLNILLKLPEGRLASLSLPYNQTKLILLNNDSFKFADLVTGKTTVFTDTELAHVIQLKITKDPTLIQDPQMKELIDILQLHKELSACENDPASKKEIQFSCNIKLTLMKHQANYEYAASEDVINPQRISYIKLLLQRLMSIPNTDAQKISDTLKAIINASEYSAFIREHLSEMRGELMKLIVGFTIANKAKSAAPVAAEKVSRAIP